MEGENYPLDEATITLMTEIQAAQTELQKQSLILSSKMEGALILFMRQQGLQGPWKVAANGRELERAPEPAPAQQQQT